MKQQYTELELATAIEEILEDLPEDRMLYFTEKFPCCDEIRQFGALGPTGSGLGKFGGHVVGD
jgi:hypothetical protein